MTKFRIEQHADKLLVSGELTRHTINKKNHLNMAPFLTGGDIVIDLSAVKKVDTAGLAWLLAIIESYNSQSGKLHFSHLSDDLVKLAKLSGVDAFIPTLS
ncbi:MAG: STAS domain-containing protein [Thalassotalea sp.]